MLLPRSYKIYLNENTIAISKRQAWPPLLYPLKLPSLNPNLNSCI